MASMRRIKTPKGVGICDIDVIDMCWSSPTDLRVEFQPVRIYGSSGTHFPVVEFRGVRNRPEIDAVYFNEDGTARPDRFPRLIVGVFKIGEGLYEISGGISGLPFTIKCKNVHAS